MTLLNQPLPVNLKGNLDLNANVLSLDLEWERLHLLGACLAALRGRESISVSMVERLEKLHGAVLTLRNSTPWLQVVSRYELSPLDQEILVCALGAVAEPRLELMYQELQIGSSSPHPRLSLIRELCRLAGTDHGNLHERVSEDAPLLRHGLIEHRDYESPDSDSIKPTAKAYAELLGWEHGRGFSSIPGVSFIEANANWDDLVLPAYCMRALREFMLWITSRNQGINKWGAGVSGGPVALFAGPPGTGKTLAAKVIAHMLGRPLCRVDLGLLVSKYGEEKEKNLDDLFGAIQHRHIVLLFDKADSLFDHKGEGRDEHRHFADTEVSHLLSRIERYQGACILTSNLSQHLDQVFARRFHVVVEFPHPDAAARAELWRRHLPPAASLAADVNMSLLGSASSLTGEHICSAALRATTLAGGNGGMVDLPILAQSVWKELAEDGREVMASDLGDLAKYLPGDIPVGVV